MTDADGSLGSIIPAFEPLELGPPPPIFIPAAGPVAGAPPPSPVAAASPPPAAPAPSPAPAPTPPPVQAQPAPKPPAPAPALQTYTVQPGDTLGDIAAQNGTTVSEIVKANPQISDPNNIYVGQKIKLPGKGGSTPSAPRRSGGGGSTQPSTPTPQRPPVTSPEQRPPQPQPSTSGDLIFPLWNKPDASWKDGPRYFGAPRSGGRKHGGCDLYAPYGSKIRAIADGEVIQPPYYFYDGTNALEVWHPGVGVVRYGEISSGKVVPMRAGQKVKAGEHIAYVGLLDSLGMHMIHFELYGESARGQPLTTDDWPFRRNRALKDPTSLIDKLYKITFG